jgi:transposase
MNFYNVQHEYYCGVDLHAKSMYLCILNKEGKALVHRNIRTDSRYFLKVLEPYRENIIVGVECMFSWYWLADLCTEHGIPFTLGHCLYMKAIHGGKAKNDKIDSKKIAALLRGGMFPTAYVYPADMRSCRDLMRRRIHFARKRAELVTHVQQQRIQYNLPEFKRPVRNRYGNAREGIVEQFKDPFVQKSIEADMLTIEHYDEMLK